jgi:hypothetical protein
MGKEDAMTNDRMHIALFKDDELDQVADALERIHKIGVPEWDISIISGVPIHEKALGRPISWTRIPVIGLAGAVVGFLAACFLNFGTPWLYPLRVGGQPFFPIPTSIVVTFELTMLGLLIATFLGVFLETISPTFGPRGYHPDVTNGSIGLVFTADEKLDARVHEAVNAAGGKLVHQSEVVNL